MLRFFVVISCHLFTALFFIIRMRLVARKKNLSEQERYDYGRHVIKRISKISRITVNAIGLENIPEKDGFVMYPNHQGKYDALGLINACPRRLSFVIKNEKSHAPMLNEIINLFYAKRLKKEDVRGSIRMFNQIGDEIANGRNYFIFPEGEWRDKTINQIGQFNTGCLSFLNRAKCPIVPVALLDTYKVYGINSLKKVTCTISFLKPIEYEEYKNLSKREIADLVRERIIEEFKNHPEIAPKLAE